MNDFHRPLHCVITFFSVETKLIHVPIVINSSVVLILPITTKINVRPSTTSKLLRVEQRMLLSVNTHRIQIDPYHAKTSSVIIIKRIIRVDLSQQPPIEKLLVSVRTQSIERLISLRRKRTPNASHPCKSHFVKLLSSPLTRIPSFSLISFRMPMLILGNS